MSKDGLTDRERRRLDRFEKMQQNRRGRSSPAVMPSKLARTAAFAPRKKSLITDSNFKRVYEFRPHTVVEVSGRELGAQHRDALYALFKLRAKRTEEPNPLYNPNVTSIGAKAPKPTLIYYHTLATWREILKATGRTAHVNNLGTVLRTFEEMRKVNFRVYTGTFDQYLAASKQGRLAGPGFSDNLLNEIEWDGVELDSAVRVRHGAWVREMFETKTLVSVDSEVYSKLKSDYAKSLWPHIDSQNNYSWIDVEAVAELSGLDYAILTTWQKVKLREETRQAFDDMVAAGGLAEWRCEQTGSGRIKGYRYHYVHAAPCQGVLDLLVPEDELVC